MRWPVLRSAVCVGLGIVAGLAMAEDAGAQSCDLEKRQVRECRTGYTYQLRRPEFWNPARPIPTVVLLHDGGGNGAELVEDPRLIEAFIDRGFALLAPDALTRWKLRVRYPRSRSDWEAAQRNLESTGMVILLGTYPDKTFVIKEENNTTRELEYRKDTGWYYYNIDRVYFGEKDWGEFEEGSAYLGRDEIAMLRAVLDDAARNSGTDRTPELIIGIGHGGSLVWQIACHAPDLAGLFAPVEGAFWETIPGNCQPGARLVHTHDRNSSFWPIQGSTSNRLFDRTSIYGNVEMLRRANGCGVTEGAGGAAGQGVHHSVWSDCMLGGQVELITMDETFDFQPWWLEEIVGRLTLPPLEDPPAPPGPQFTKPSDGARLARPEDTPEIPQTDDAPDASGSEGGAKFTQPGSRPGFTRPGERPGFSTPGQAPESPFKRPK